MISLTKIYRLLIILLLVVFSSSIVSAQGNEILKITFEKDKSDVINIHNHVIQKAYAYGTEEHLIQFLINGKYIMDQMGYGIIYNFLLANFNQLSVADNLQMAKDTNVVLLLASDTVSYNTILSLVKVDSASIRNKSFKLGVVNDLNVYVSNSLQDTSFFAHNQEIVRVVLDKSRSDAFQIEGETIPTITILGTKDNIIRFLINGKYIKHKMDEGSRYFFKSSDIDNFNQYFTTSQKRSKVLIMLNKVEDFVVLYNSSNSKEKIKNNTIVAGMSIQLTDIPEIDVVVIPPVVN